MFVFILVPIFRFLGDLFRPDYWRALARFELWRQAGVAIRRLHKDKRAWKTLSGLFWLSLPAVWLLGTLLGVLVLGMRDDMTVSFAALILIGMGSSIRSRAARPAPQPVAWVPNPLDRPMFPGHFEREAERRKALRAECGQLTILLAVLIDRAQSERFLRTKFLPENVEVTTRQNHLQILRGRGILDVTDGAARDMLLLPDGHWTEAQEAHIFGCIEGLRVLRWAVRADRFLPMIGSPMKLPWGIVRDCLDNAAQITEGRELIDATTIHVALNSAQRMLERTYNEGALRGLYTFSDESISAAMRDAAASMTGKGSMDDLLDAKTVSEAPDEHVLQAAEMAFRRIRVLRWLLRRLDGYTESTGQLRVDFEVEQIG